MSGVSLNVAPGELRAVIGPNGAGKTTFFNLISGFFRPTAGQIVFDGKDVTKLSAYRRVESGMARTFQITEIFPELTVHENIRIAAEVAAGLPPAPVDRPRANCRRGEQVDEVLELTGACQQSQRLVGELAHGDQRAAEIAMALALRPRLLLLDEPTAGMGDQETYEITSLIRRLHRDDRLHDRAHRARHAGGVSPRRPDDGAGPGAPAGRGHSAGDRRQRGGAGRLSGEDRHECARGRRACTRSMARATSCTTCSLTVAEGRITTLLGRNGAGKTTTLRSLMGLTPAQRGKVMILGQADDILAAVSHRRPGRRVRAGGAPHLPESDRRGEPAGADRARRAVDAFAYLRVVPASRGAQARIWGGNSPAASRRCCRSPAHCLSIPSC